VPGFRFKLSAELRSLALLLLVLLYSLFYLILCFVFIFMFPIFVYWFANHCSTVLQCSIEDYKRQRAIVLSKYNNVCIIYNGIITFTEA